jgi:hypothetical protein
MGRTPTKRSGGKSSHCVKSAAKTTLIVKK